MPPPLLSLPADLCHVLEECLGQACFIALLQWPQDNLSCIDAEKGFPISFLATAVLTLYSYKVWSMDELLQVFLLKHRQALCSHTPGLLFNLIFS